MGWADCGFDSKGRPIGYAHQATCDHEGCEEKIDRGLAYACGGEHMGGDSYCEDYFCSEHLLFGDERQLCLGCKLDESVDYIVRFAKKRGRKQ